MYTARYLHHLQCNLFHKQLGNAGGIQTANVPKSEEAKKAAQQEAEDKKFAQGVTLLLIFL